MIVFHFVQGIGSRASAEGESISLRIQNRGKFSRAAKRHVLRLGIEAMQLMANITRYLMEDQHEAGCHLFYSLAHDFGGNIS